MATGRRHHAATDDDAVVVVERGNLSGGDAVGGLLELDRPAYGVAPGQIAVLYDDGVVVGSGVVSAAPRN